MAAKSANLRITGLALLIAVALPAWTTFPRPVAQEEEDEYYIDFNGDGKEDLAIGIIGEDFPGLQDAGAVQVIYGSNSGLTSKGDQFWHMANLNRTAQTGAIFGWAMGAGDINNDGFSDLAVGVPNYDRDSTEHTGAVVVLFGSKKGLTAQGNVLLDLGNEARATDALGASVYVGDVNGDELHDVIAGLSGRDLGNKENAGAIAAFYSQGKTFSAPQIIHQDTPGIKGAAQRNAVFGSAITAGYFLGNDDILDVAVAAGGHSANKGAVNVIAGTKSGLKPTGNLFLLGGARGDVFGFSIATIPDRNNRDRILVGAAGARQGRGEVYIVSGTTRELVFMGENPGEFAGFSVAAGDVIGRRRADLIIGIPGFDGTFAPLLPVLPALPVHLLGDRGYTCVQDNEEEIFEEEGPAEGEEGNEEIKGPADDRLTANDFAPCVRVQHPNARDLELGGRAVTTVNATGKGAQVSVGVPQGIVNNIRPGVVYTGDLRTLKDKVFHQNTAGIDDSNQHGDFFGWSFAAGVRRD